MMQRGKQRVDRGSGMGYGGGGGRVETAQKAAADGDDMKQQVGESVGVGRVAMLRASLESRHTSSSFRPIVRAV
jgi:hypothetical protein